MRKIVWFLTLLVGSLALGGQASAADGARKVYAHYMGCCPAGHGAIPYWFSQAAKQIARTNDLHAAVGGSYVNWPLMPFNPRLDFGMEANAVLEIRRAIRAGIDGFAFDAWAGGDNARKELDAFFAAAEKLGVDFGLTICFDPSCHTPPAEGMTMVDRYVETARYVLRHRDSPNLARFDGKPLFFGYYSTGIDYGNQKDPLDVRLAREKKAWDAFRAKLGTPVFLHGSVDSYAVGKGTDWAFVGSRAAEIYDAVGGFTGGDWSDADVLAQTVLSAGKVWSEPLIFQYSNKSGGIISEPGLNLLHRRWRQAIARGARLLQFVTWNDYAEETCLAPATGGGYTVGRVNRYYADWWKTGKPPAVEKDEIHVVYRRWAGDAPCFPFRTRTPVLPPSVLEVVTFLTAPGEVCVAGLSPYAAPAGMFVKQFPLTPGRVAAAVRREGRTVCQVEAPEPVAARRWREDFTLVAHGSTYADAWKDDFGDLPLERYAENADADGDGLPNWFEMVYGGTFPYLSKATGLAPGDDPDGDGLTNLQEYEGGTHPLLPDTPYRVGETWDFADVLARPFVFNPERDAHRRDVWFFAFNNQGRPRNLAWNGCYPSAPVTGGAAQWRNLYCTNWTTRMSFTTNRVELYNRHECSMLVSFQAPVSGVYAVEAEAVAGQGGGCLYPMVCKGAEELGRTTLKAGERTSFAFSAIRLKAGERLHFTGDSRDMWGLNPLAWEKIRLRLLERAMP